MKHGLHTRFRLTALAIGCLLIVFTVGLVWQLPWATNVWPWPDTPLSYLFVGSVVAAVVVALVWIGWNGEWGALPAGALNILVIALTTALYFFLLFFQGQRSLFLFYGLIDLLIALVSASAFLWSRRIPLQSQLPTPRLVRFSFGLFALLLLLAGGALIVGWPIFPWPLRSDSSVIFGCIFLGDACYFFYGLLYPRWHNARGQLLSFLAYDLVLIFPFLQLFASVQPAHRLSLIIYMVVLLYSGILAAYYLFLDKKVKAGKPARSTALKL